MAPSSNHPGLHAEVIVDGCPLTEYNDDEELRPNTTTVYIQSEAGEQFGVRYFIPASLFEEHGIKAEVSIDGVSMRKYIHDNYVGRLHGVSRFACASSAHVGRLYLGQRFRFAALDTHDETEIIDTHVRNQLAVTGDISVSFYRITNIRIASAGKKVPTIQEYDKVPEKALKGSAVSLKTKLDPFERIAPVTWVEADHIDREGRPFAVIQFKYRSAAALRSLGVIPRLQSPLPTERCPISQSGSTNRSLLLKDDCIKEEEEKTPAMKRKRTDGHEDGEVELMGERSAKRRCLPTDKDEVIVLE